MTDTIHYVRSVVVVLEFPRTNYSVFENEDSVTVCLTTSIGSNQPINVIVSTSPKTATGQ